MKKRSFDEMIVYFNRRVADMNISQDCKMELLGMIAAIGYEHETSVSQWIPCSERLPVEHTEVLTYDSSFGITFDSLHRGKWRKHPVAWMPLPEPWRGEK